MPALLPRHFRDLRLALAVLYHFESSAVTLDDRQSITPHQAHEFLIQWQSRNVRRKILSLHQSHHDAMRRGGETHHADTRIEMGSTWLVCLYILAQPFNTESSPTSTERLFCAQTLLQRLRRSKMIEAVDWEMESNADFDYHQALAFYQQYEYLNHIFPTYKHWIRAVSPFIGNVLDNYQAPESPTPDDEERTKGELSLLTLATIMYMTASSYHDSQTGPTLAALGSCMSVMALRLRYTPASIDQHGGAVPDTAPMVILIRHTLVMVWEVALETNNAHPLAYGAVVNACLAAIPDTLLGSPGGARGRLSIDPRCIRCAALEMRSSGLGLMWETLMELRQLVPAEAPELTDLWTLTTCLAWAKFLPLPGQFIEHVAPLVKLHLPTNESHHQRAAFGLVTAVCEGAALSVEDVLSQSMGLGEHQLIQQPNKKRQSGKSRKRQKDLVEANTTDSLVEQARSEVRQRGEVSCVLVHLVWDPLNSRILQALTTYNTVPSSQADGEGPLGCLAAAANGCLPFILRNPNMPDAGDIFLGIAYPFQDMCQSRNKGVRGFCTEPLLTLHAAAVADGGAELEAHPTFETVVVNHFFKCLTNLAEGCAYPDGYFDELGSNSDEDLEIERNDVRDLLRTLTMSGEGGSTAMADYASAPVNLPFQLLARLLAYCEASVTKASEHGRMVPEATAHMFSALAKPLNALALAARKAPNPDNLQLVNVAVRLLQAMNEQLLSNFDGSRVLQQLLPLSRTVNIATASLTPLLSTLCEDPVFIEAIHPAIQFSLHAAALSIANLPELFAPSALGRHPYDIRGTFRSPGGDDHVGCLALTRLVSESVGFGNVVAVVCMKYFPSLCDLHQDLKLIEERRGRAVMHGEGVTPKSRRILLNALCELNILLDGRADRANVLTDLFVAAVSKVASYQSRFPLEEQDIHNVAECVFDLASYSPSIVYTLFEDKSDLDGLQRAACLEVLTSACIDGYRRLTTDTADHECEEWNRLRAALFFLLRLAASPDVPSRAAEVIQVLIVAECEAVRAQCDAGPTAYSSIFRDEVICPDVVPAGVFVRILYEALRAANGNKATQQHMNNCILALQGSVAFVLTSILSECQEPETFVDPRPTLMEAWLLAMVELSKLRIDTFCSSVSPVLVETFVSMILLLFYPTVPRLRGVLRADVGLSLDGPQSLAFTDFLTGFLALGPEPLALASAFFSQKIPVEAATLNGTSGDARISGAAVVGAAIFRGIQGALPPWSVESAPDIFSSFFVALRQDPELFGHVLRLSMNIRAGQFATRLGSLEPGQLLSGPFFATLSSDSKDLFVAQAVQLSRTNDIASWRRFKTLVKQICGGKRRDTDFGQKPAATKWDFERI